MHLANWSRPDEANAVREASRRVKSSTTKHRKYADKIVTYIVDTPKRGWHLKNLQENGNKKECVGVRGLFEDAPISIKSVMQKIITLSSTEVELIALVQCVQEMMAAKRLLESMNLKVRLPMLIECDNKGAVDLVNGYQVGAGTKYIDVRTFFVRDLKDDGVIEVKWISTARDVSFTSFRSSWSADLTTFSRLKLVPIQRIF